MNYFEANRILDLVKDGAQYLLHTINKALELTGDRLGTFEEFGSGGMDAPLQKESQRSGSIRSTSVVAGHDCRH